ncbi:uncharacterized protein VTP21DRAFT_395 [Calcarisporiella thermophila]|uniref:uncharacterized protein n=1 Tax=Calcarisporiella thermophila TaxID=911321 RepID=UPI003742AA5E
MLYGEWKMTNLKECQEKLTSEDAIMEPGIDSVLGEFVKLGGQPVDAVSFLADSYVGLPSMFNLLSSWSKDLGLDATAVMEREMKNMLIERFSPKAVDGAFMNSKDVPEWLEEMIKYPVWRSMFYELSEKHPNSALLNFAIQRIADAGHQSEIARVATASTFLNVFTGVLIDTFDRLREEDDITLQQKLPDLTKICCQSDRNYVYAQTLLQQLISEQGGKAFKRISRELELAAADQTHRAPLIPLIRHLLNNAPARVAKVLTAITEQKQPAAGDIVELYKLYNDTPPPSVEHLRDPGILEKFVEAVFTPPKPDQVARPDLIDKMVWLLAYAASVHESNDAELDKTEFEDTYKRLKTLSQLIARKSIGGDLSSCMKEILEVIDLPMASMGIIVWINYILEQTDYYETYFRRDVVPVQHLLLEEIAYRHPHQRAHVFTVLYSNFELQRPKLHPEIGMLVRKSLLDQMIHLMQLGFVTPVVRYMARRATALDQSLAAHFAKRMLELALPPYPEEFVKMAVKFVEPVADVLVKSADCERAVIEFLDAIEPNQEPPISADLMERVQHLRKRFGH